MKTGAVILAAEHKAERGMFRPMVPVGDSTAIKRIIITLRQAGADPIVVITGRNGDELEKHISKMRVISLRNEEYETCHMYRSVLMGLQYIEDLCDRVLVLPSQFPMLLPDTIERMMETEGDVVCPVYQGRKGHPVLISKELIPVFTSYTGENGLRGAMRQPEIEKRLVRIPVEDQGIIMPVENSGDALGLAQDRQIPIHAVSQIRLEKEEVFFGPGIAQLLSLIDHTGSIQMACRQMHMSYSKGWKIIKAAEKQMGFPLLITRSGGQDGGFSQLTPKTRLFLERFTQMEKEMDREARRLFEKYFGEEKIDEENVSGNKQAAY